MRWMTLKPYCSRYACPCTSSIFLANPYGALVSSGIAVPQVVLPERHRRELGIRADRADLDELLHAPQARLLHEGDAHDGVVMEEAARVLPVGTDAADDRSEVDDDIRPAVGECVGHAIGRAQVVVRTSWHEDIGRRPPRRAA